MLKRFTHLNLNSWQPEKNENEMWARFWAEMFLGCCNFTGQLGMLYECGIGNFPKGMFIWETLSWLARKHFDKFTSEISSSNKNSMKSYLTFIWDEKFSFLIVFRLLIGEISVHGKILVRCERNSQKLYQVIPVSGIMLLMLTAQSYFANWNILSFH